MSAETVEVFVPCAPVAVRVRVGPSESLTTLERLTLEAVHRGVGSFAELASLFGLGDRVMLDLVFDLWRVGHLLVDTLRGEVMLSDEARRAMNKGGIDGLAPAGTAEEIRELMQDQLVGHVMSSRHRARGRRDAASHVPSHPFEVSLDDVRPEDLLAALADDQRRDPRLGGDRAPMAILAANLTRARSIGTNRPMWLPIKVRVTETQDEDSLIIDVLEAGTLPHAARGRLARCLESLVETAPGHPLIAHLRAHARPTRSAPATPHGAYLRLTQRIPDLGRAEPALHAAQHDQLLELANEVLSGVEAGASLANSVVIGPEDHDSVITDLITSAERQIVISTAWIRETALDRVLPALREALSKHDLQLFVLWGMRHDDELDPRVLRQLHQLRTEFPNSVFVSARSAVTHAKFVVQDDRRALVTSHNILSGRHGSLEVGVLLKAPGHPQRCRMIETMLGWAREQYPDYLAARGLFHLAEDFTEQVEVAEFVVPPLPTRPSPAPEDGMVAGTRLADLHLWKASWEAFADGVGRALGELGAPAVELVRDGHHRVVLMDALETATQRLVITSDQMSRDVVNEPFLAALERALDRGVQIALIYQRPLRDVLEALAPLCGRYERLRVVQAPSHAKLLVSDDALAVSSFNFLSFEGFYATGPSARRRQRSELGVALRNASAADAVVRRLSEFVPQLAAVSESATPVQVPVAPIDARPFQLVQAARDLLDQLGRAGDARALLVEAVDTAADAAGLFEALHRAGVDTKTIAAAVSHALLTDRLAAADRRRWIGRLVAIHIADGRLVEAAILRTGVELPELPDARVLALAAALDETEVTALANAAGELPSGHPDWPAIGVLGALRLLLHGEPAAESLIDLGGDPPTPAWADLLGLIRGFYRSTWQAFPMAAVRSRRESASAVEEIAEAWQRLTATLDTAAQKEFDVAWVAATHALVHHPEEPFGALHVAVAARDHEGVRRWVDQYRSISLERLIDEAARRAGDGHQRLHHAPRQVYLKLLRNARASATALAALEPLETEGTDPALFVQAQAFCRGVAERWDDLVDQSSQADPAVQVILDIALKRLEPIIEGCEG